ncbi:hypothetical protein Fmac_004553 [Flemingia macrophylla]|uniref:CCHC-type domain-containing protein n=1 Tax=Flemingia macrophylla TaxID=520843 RepID=A0ABD1N5H8_9FABA
MVRPPRRPPSPPPTDVAQLARAMEALAAAMLQQSQTMTQQVARFDHLMHLYPPEIVEERTRRQFEEDSRPGIPRMVILVIVAQTEERLDRGGRVAKGQFGGSSSDRGGRRRNLSRTPYHRPQQPQQAPPAELIHARFGVPPTPQIIRCFICGGPHVVCQCPQKDNRTCFLCRKVGHLAKDCRVGSGISSTKNTPHGKKQEGIEKEVAMLRADTSQSQSLVRGMNKIPGSSLAELFDSRRLSKVNVLVDALSRRTTQTSSMMDKESKLVE